MEQIKGRSMSLRKSFILYVLAAFSFVVIVSGALIWSCLSVQKWLLPDSDKVYLNIELTYEDGTTSNGKYRMKIGEDLDQAPFLLNDPTDLQTFVNAKYSVTSIETSFTSLSPKRQLLYRVCGVAMIALPVLLSLAGILFCGFIFYKRKLKTPIGMLSRATDKIKEQDLDFTLSSHSGDELGALCRSFEQMRAALQENNKKMWEMLEERKHLQASVAHDLRNPISIIEGHAEYLQINLSDGNLSNDKIYSIAGNIGKAAERLERYTESIRTINHLEELEVERKQVDFSELHDEMLADFTRLTEGKGITVSSENFVSAKYLNLDPQVLYRILENLIGNAVRYAEREIHLSFTCSDNVLTVSVADDGPGFTEKFLKAKQLYFLSDNDNTERSGMGLTICRILCQKHGGSISISNSGAGGAVVKFIIEI